MDGGERIITLVEGTEMAGPADRWSPPLPSLRRWFTLTAILFTIACRSTEAAYPRADDAGATEFFEKSIRPILAERCQKCHGAGKTRGGLSLAGRALVLKGGDSGPAAVPGKPRESLIIEAVEQHGELKMPPEGKLSPAEVNRLRHWIELDMPWPEAHAGETVAPAAAPADSHEARDWWSFRPVRLASPPPVKDTGWPRSEIDRFILAALEARGMTPSPAVDRRTLIRRASYDLTGLPPTPEEVESFVADRSPDAFARVVDRLLASPAYGERWGRHWLDVVRYADARDLIQLPAESDFRESWRYRDWVIAAFNRDMSYAEFVRFQIAGDLLPPPKPGGIDPEAIVATGLLALADFVPGDVDKDQMIADYVDDQVNVVGKAFLGLTIGCARCHDHKFDPISAEDYYALAGIFFSTSLVPGPVPGNTPLIRVPLLSADEIARLRARDAADGRRRAELEQQLPDADDRAWIAHVGRLIAGQSARYLVAACEHRLERLTIGRPTRFGPDAVAVPSTPPAPPFVRGGNVGDPPVTFPPLAKGGFGGGSPSAAMQELAALGGDGSAKVTLDELARQRGLHPALLAGWVEYLDRVKSHPKAGRHPILTDAASGKLSGPALTRGTAELERALADLAARREARSSSAPDLSADCVLRFRADDPYLVSDTDSRVTLWPNRAGLPADARPPTGTVGPLRTTAAIGGRPRAVLRFDGRSLLEARHAVPPSGSLFLVFRTADGVRSGHRLIGWEDSDFGKHGAGLLLEPGHRLQAVLRKDGLAGDLADARPAPGFEVVRVTWGPDGTTLRRNGAATVSQKAIDGVSSDPGIVALRIGGPGSGSSARFRGDLAELRVYGRQLDEAGCKRIEDELHRAWFEADDPNVSTRDPVAELFDELRSARGPFWPSSEERSKLLPPEHRTRRAALALELEALKKRPAIEIPQAVAVQDGGPKGTRHEGFKDARVFVRGNHKKPGKTVSRGFPRILTNGQPVRITAGSGRKQLADWLTRLDHPLTARVMFNRIWEHHFGEGLVRTANDFGRRGDPPSHPELLDLLAARFVQSGWSVKAMHRLIMLSSTYQQGTRVDAAQLSADPENRLLGRMNRRRLDAEAIRDGLLAVAGRLEIRRGGPAFAELAVPRRTVYLMSVRTGPGTSASDFGRLFNRADPGSIVARRDESVVAPQALFFLNDPFVNEMARALAARLARDEPMGGEPRIRRLHALALGRPPSLAEVDLARRLLAADGDVNPWERYCQVILSSNEFIYID